MIQGNALTIARWFKVSTRLFRCISLTAGSVSRDRTCPMQRNSYNDTQLLQCDQLPSCIRISLMKLSLLILFCFLSCIYFLCRIFAKPSRKTSPPTLASRPRRCTPTSSTAIDASSSRGSSARRTFTTGSQSIPLNRCALHNNILFHESRSPFFFELNF